jgi:ethanolamine utilization protein EutA
MRPKFESQSFERDGMSQVDEEDAGGRVFFSNAGRSLEGEDEIVLISVGVDIGSSTSHIIFSRLVLERLDNRYVVSKREIIHQSEVLLTPYAADRSIDVDGLGAFITEQYKIADIVPEEIDTGALILTGVAVRRKNARAIGELFAAQAGKFVALSAGDALEATLSAYGSGAAARSIRDAATTMNIDIGGGTTKIALCEEGQVKDITAIDIGARVVALDAEGNVARLEEAGARFAGELGLDIKLGAPPATGAMEKIAEHMADRLLEAIGAAPLSEDTAELLRLEPMAAKVKPQILTFSGGVSEFIYGRETASFGDLGAPLAHAIRTRIEAWGVPIEQSREGIRATVVGASQYTVQVSGSTIFVSPADTLPVRNIPVIVPDVPLDAEELDPNAFADAIARALRRLDLHDYEKPVAIFYRWQGSATYARLDAFARGMAQGMEPLLARGMPLILVGDGDVGGLIGIHYAEEMNFKSPIVSIDGITMSELDFIDIGALLPASGAVPVVIKSLVFPANATLGKAA